MLTFSIDEDTLPRCPYDGVRTVMIDDSQINQNITIEKCNICNKTFKFVVELDEEDDEEVQYTTD
jgi:hypothetical protein